MLLSPLTSISSVKDKIFPKKKEQNLMHFSTGYGWSISSMKINLWFCYEMNQWRWTLTDSTRPICKQESGQQPFLRDAMEDIANTVEYMIKCKQPE